MEVYRTKGYSHIFQVEDFDSEFHSLFSKGDVKRYDKWLYRRLDILDSEKTDAVDGFRIEKIPISESRFDLYSIRYSKSKSNPRILFTFLQGNEFIILLCAFLEKNAADYKSAILRSKNLVDMLLERNERL